MAHGVLTHRDGLVQCHICGSFYGHLGCHVKVKHGLDADAYREQFGLNRGTGLIGASLAEHRRKNRTQLTPLRGSKPRGDTGRRHTYRSEGALNRAWVRDASTGRFVG